MNLMKVALEAAKKHPEDKAIQSLVSNLNNAVLLERTRRMQTHDSLLGYRKGIDGEDGYYPITHSIMELGVERALATAGEVFKVGIILDCLIMALIAIGENIEY